MLRVYLSGNHEDPNNLTHKLEIGFQALHDQADGLGSHQLSPLLPVLRVGVNSKVGDPVDSGGFSITVVVDIVDVALVSSLLSAS